MAPPSPTPALAAALCTLALVAGGGWWLRASLPQPDNAEIHATAMRAQWGHQADATAQLRRWAGQGSPVAQRELASVLSAANRGQATDEAWAWYRAAAAQGDAEAAYQLGELLRAPSATAQPDWPSARAHYEQAARAGHATAMLALGRMLKNGEGGAPDAAGAVAWFQRAANLGHAQARFLLANAYASGEGVARDPQRAFALLQLAAEAHFPPAMHELALQAQQRDVAHGTQAETADHLLKEAEEERRNRWRDIR